MSNKVYNFLNKLKYNLIRIKIIIGDSMSESTKRYIVIIVALAVFFLVLFLILKFTDDNSASLNKNNAYHIIYYDYNQIEEQKEEETTSEEETSEEDFGVYYDDPIYNAEDIEELLESENTYPINIYKNGNNITIVREYETKCDYGTCPTEEKSYEINFSDNGKEILSEFITTKFTNSDNREIILYKSDLTDMELKIIDSIKNNDESYLK